MIIQVSIDTNNALKETNNYPTRPFIENPKKIYLIVIDIII